MSENRVLEMQPALESVEDENGTRLVRPESIRDHFAWLQAELFAQTKWQDSYGVPGSEWDVCEYCGEGDEPGVFATGVHHHPRCPLCPREI